MTEQQQPQISPDGNWQWNGQQWIPYQAQQGAQGPRPPEDPKPPKRGFGGWWGRRSTKAKAWLIIGAVVVGFSLISAVTPKAPDSTNSSSGGGGQATNPQGPPATTAAPTVAPTPTPTATPAPTPPPTPKPAPQPVQLVTASGTGSGETPKFHPTSHYTVKYSFDCSVLGQSGNFILSVDDDNGSPTFGEATVNRLATSGQGTANGYNMGDYTVHVQVITECTWNLTVMSAP